MDGRFALARPDDRVQLEIEIRKAHVLCVVYAIDNPHSFDRIPTYWLPYFKQLGVNASAVFYINSRDTKTSLGTRDIGRKQDRLEKWCRAQ